MHPFKWRKLVFVLSTGLVMAIPLVKTVEVCFQPVGGPGKALAFASGPPTGHTNAPGEFNCTTAGCHSGANLNSGDGQLIISGLPTSWAPNTRYTNIQITLMDPTATRWGFQVIAKGANGQNVGTFTPTDTFTLTQGGYLSHTNAGTFSGQNSDANWTFNWTAPAAGAGNITFYVAGNAANNNNSNSGDRIYVIQSSALTETDSTPPVFASGAVKDGTDSDVDYLANVGNLNANWNAATDGESTVDEYSVSVGTTAGGTDILAYTSVGTATSHFFAGLTLPYGTQVFVNVRAKNNRGLVSEVASSNGVAALSSASPCNVDGTVGNNTIDPSGGDVAALAQIVIDGNDPGQRCLNNACNFDGAGGEVLTVGDVARLLDIASGGNLSLLRQVCSP